jgi:Uma2 family endonuclease
MAGKLYACSVKTTSKKQPLSRIPSEQFNGAAAEQRRKAGQAVGPDPPVPLPVVDRVDAVGKVRWYAQGSMSRSPGKRPANYQDLLVAPDHLVAEIVDDELVTSPRPATRHAAAASSLGADLHTSFGRSGGPGPGGWVLLDEPELHLVGQILVPDLADWRRARMPEVPDVAFFELVPDWICEVIPPTTAALDRTRKAHHYCCAEVGHLWFVDPELRTLDVFRLEAGAWRLMISAAGDVKVLAEPFDEIELELAGLWAR